METPESIQVSIFHHTYRLRSHSGGERVRRLAQLVDERMQAISSQLATHDVAKIAVLAALNIADEMEGLKDRYEKELQTLLSQSTRTEKEAVQEDATKPTEGDDRRSWFEDIFDSDEQVKSGGERLSSRVTAKLQTLRQAGQGRHTIETDED